MDWKCGLLDTEFFSRPAPAAPAAPALAPLAVCRGQVQVQSAQSAEVIGAMQRVVKGEDVLASVAWRDLVQADTHPLCPTGSIIRKY